VFCQYHRAIFLIYCPWIMPLAASPCAEGNAERQLRQHCMEQCIESACAVIKAANTFAACEYIVVEKCVLLHLHSN